MSSLTGDVAGPISVARVLALAAGACTAVSALAAPLTYTQTGTAPGDFSNFFRAINYDGNLIAGFGTPGIGFNGRATVRNFDLGLQPFSLGLPPGSAFSDSTHITGDGLIVFGRGSTGAWVYELPGPIVALAGGSLTDISRDGTRKLWNGFVSPGRQVGAGPITLLPNVTPFLPEVRGVAISPDGDQVVGYGRNVIPGGGYGDPDIVQEVASVWDASTNTWTQLGGLAGEKSRAIRISEDGAVVVGESDAFDPSFAIVTRAWIKIGAGPQVDLTAPISEELEGRILDMSDDGSTVLMTVGGVEYLWDAVNGARNVRDVLQALNHLPLRPLTLAFRALSGDGKYVAGDRLSGLDLIAFAAPIVDACPVPSNGPPSSIEVILKNGDPVPGLPGTVVTEVRDASMGDGSTVALQILANGEPTLLSGVPGLTWSPMATIGGASPVPGETFIAVGAGIAKFGDAAAFSAQLSPSATAALFTGSPAGGVQLLARDGDPVPSLSATYDFATLGGPLFNNVGEASFFAGLSSGGFLFFAGAPGAVQPVFINPATRAEFPVGASFNTPRLLGYNDKGQILLTENVTHASVPADADEVLMVRTPSVGTSWIRVAEGRQAPGRAPGVVYGTLGGGFATAFDRNGRVAFENTPSDGVTGLFVESDSGIAPLLNVGDELPGVPGSVITFFSDFALDDRRGIVASVFYNLGGESGQAAWASSTAGFSSRVLAKRGDPAPDVVPCGVIDSASVVAANRHGQALLRVTLTGNAYGPGDFVLYLHDPVRGLVKLAQAGAPFEVGVGDVRTINQIERPLVATGSPSHGDRRWLDHAGNALAMLSFTDGTKAAVRFFVKPTAPTCPADFNGDGLVDDADFVIFVPEYNTLLVPPADGACDLNLDGAVDDGDFTFFAVAYNELICP